MRLILVGPPGSGKGTQAKLLSTRLGLMHIGTGDILRDTARRNTPAGQRAAPFMALGKLVPDDIVNELVADLFRRDERPDCFVMDGYPRTLAQAASFDQVLRQQYLDLQSVIQLLVDDDEIVRRLTGRWSCPTCKASYHVTMKPPRTAGICDEPHHTPLVQREDDKEETIRKRLADYHQSTEPLIAHYRGRSLVRGVPGVGGVEEIYSSILSAVKSGPERAAP